MRLAGTLALLSLSTVAAALGSSLDPKDGAVLPENIAQQILHQCSRSVPQNVTGTWSPNPTQIGELESRLPAALEAVTLERGSDYGQSRGFRRQYVGLIVGRHKIVYVNAFPSGMGGPERRPSANGRQEFDWRRDAVLVCDGGPAFFGVEYDPATKRFSHFAFNGIA